MISQLRKLLTEAVGTGQPMVLVRTEEWDDAEAVISSVCKEHEWNMVVWDVKNGLADAQGLTARQPSQQGDASGMPPHLLPKPAAKKMPPHQGLVVAIDTVAAMPEPDDEDDVVSTLLVVRNLHKLWREGDFAQVLEVLQTFQCVHKPFKLKARTVVGIALPSEMPPPELLPLFTIINHGYPVTEEFKPVIDCVQAPDETEVRLDEDAVTTIAEACCGLTRLQAEKAVATAWLRLTVDGDVMKGMTPAQFFCSVVEEEKNSILNADGMLKRWDGKETFDDIGGNDALKEYLKLVMRPEARRKKSKRNCALLVGPPGCLDGDTVVQYRRGDRNSGRDITLADLYRKFNGLPAGSRPWTELSEPTYLHSVGNDGVVFYNRVVGVYDSGDKPVVRLTLSDGTVLRLTEDHPVATPDGDFVEAGSLSPGQAVLARGSMKPQDGDGRDLRNRPFRVLVNLKHHPHGARKIVAGYSYTRVPRSRLVLEAQMNGMPYDDFVHCLKNDAAACKAFKYLPEDVEVHHRDEDTLNDSIDNLLPMSKADHARLHSQTGNFGVQYTKELTVESVVADGTAHTYDVQMTSPANNFAANGVFVHNTGKTLAAKALGRYTGRKTYSGNLSSNKSKYVGESEANARRMFARASAMNSLILYFDEINEQVEGGESDGHSVDKALRQYLMEWLDTHHQTDDVYVVMTANDVSQMHMALTRPGRVDAVWYVGLPGKEQKAAIWAICLSKYGLDPEQFEKLPDDYGWAGVEIDACCATAHNFGITLEAAAKYIIPSSIRVKEQIERLHEWAEGRCLDAETGELFRKKGMVEPEPTGVLGTTILRKIQPLGKKKKG